MTTFLADLVFDYTLRNVTLGAAILGLVSGVLSSFAVLRKQSLFGDALSHAALPGVALAFMVTGSKSPLALLAGAMVTCWLGAMLVIGIVRSTRLKEDTALGVVLSGFFGFGLVLLTAIQASGAGNQAGLDQFLFGQAASLVASDVLVMAVLAGIALVVVLALYKELKLFTFDPAFAASLGYSVRLLNVILTSLLVLVVVIGLQTVGVVLMVAMLVGPGAAARQWTNRFGHMVILSAAFGAIAGVLGAVASALGERLPTGPLIVLSLTAVLLLSLFFAPARGIVPAALRRRRSRAIVAATMETR